MERIHRFGVEKKKGGRSFQLSRAQILIFTASRYLTLVLGAVRGVLVAGFLGPVLFGIWGFIVLIKQYVSHTSLGLQHAVTVELATVKGDARSEARVVGISIGGTLLIAVSLVLGAVAADLFDLSLFPKYRFSNFALLVALIVSVNHVQQVLRNTHRVYGSIGRVALTEVMIAAAPLLALAFYRGEALLFALLYSLLGSTLFSVIVLLVKPPFPILLGVNPRELRRLVRIGIPLLIYNASSYLITVAARTIISAFYPVDVMGYYSFANTLTTATLLGLNAIAWIVFPSILAGSTKDVPDELVRQRIDYVNALYGTAVWLVVLLMVIVLPVVFWLLPAYRPAEETLVILMLGQAVLALSFGYNCVAIARREHLRVARLSMVGVGVVTGGGLVAALAQLHYAWVAVAVLLGAIAFTGLQSRLGELLMPDAPPRNASYMKTLFRGSRVIPLGIVLLGLLVGNGMLVWSLGALMVFIILAWPELRLLFQFARSGGMVGMPDAHEN